MQSEARLQQLRLCAIIESSIDKTSEYIARYERLVTSTGLKRAKDVLDKLSYVNELFNMVYRLLCTEASMSSIDRALNMLRESYTRVMILDPPLPGAVKQMYYEILVSVMKLSETV